MCRIVAYPLSDAAYIHLPVENKPGMTDKYQRCRPDKGLWAHMHRVPLAKEAATF